MKLIEVKQAIILSKFILMKIQLHKAKGKHFFEIKGINFIKKEYGKGLHYLKRTFFMQESKTLCST